ncbi:hypothetical protein V866_000191 [Kwoniella sp. B9012]
MKEERSKPSVEISVAQDAAMVLALRKLSPVDPVHKDFSGPVSHLSTNSLPENGSNGSLVKVIGCPLFKLPNKNTGSCFEALCCATAYNVVVQKVLQSGGTRCGGETISSASAMEGDFWKDVLDFHPDVWNPYIALNNITKIAGSNQALAVDCQM